MWLKVTTVSSLAKWSYFTKLDFPETAGVPISLPICYPKSRIFGRARSLQNGPRHSLSLLRLSSFTWQNSKQNIWNLPKGHIPPRTMKIKRQTVKHADSFIGFERTGLEEGHGSETVLGEVLHPHPISTPSNSFPFLWAEHAPGKECIKKRVAVKGYDMLRHWLPIANFGDRTKTNHFQWAPPKVNRIIDFSPYFKRLESVTYFLLLFFCSTPQLLGFFVADTEKNRLPSPPFPAKPATFSWALLHVRQPGPKWKERKSNGDVPWKHVNLIRGWWFWNPAASK